MSRLRHKHLYDIRAKVVINRAKFDVSSLAVLES